TGKQFMDDIRALIQEMEDEERGLLKDRDDRSQASASWAKGILLGGTALAFVLVTLAGFLVTRSITAPLATFMGFVDRVGRGDLTQQAAITTSDEVGKLGGMLNDMVLGLRDLA